ncbi:MAG TPA: hypothetical protein ENJ45_01280 [Phaeodactylibacter sp.]|nr:hypothetical protein [Phaeodactylibacter sp.]
MKSSTTKIFRLLQWSTVFVFAGRAWQHFFYDVPLRTLLWDEAWMKPIVEGLFRISWEEYITSLNVDDSIQGAIYLMGLFYALCAVVALSIRRVPPPVAKLLLWGAGGLVLLAALYCKERFFSIGQFFEYSLQVVSPVMLYKYVIEKWKGRTLLIVAKVTIALTFICHGLYAVSYYPRPGYFVEMVMNTLAVKEAIAHQILYCAGLMDFVVAGLIFLPNKIGRYALYYIVLWGAATTLARYTAYLDFSYLAESLHQWTWEVFIRMPHFMIPIAVLLMQKERITKAIHSEGTNRLPSR